MIAIVGIRTFGIVSSLAALVLFKIKAAPLACDKTQVIWKHPSSKQLKRFDHVKPLFLERSTGLHRISLIRAASRQDAVICGRLETSIQASYFASPSGVQQHMEDKDGESLFWH